MRRALICGVLAVLCGGIAVLTSGCVSEVFGQQGYSASEQAEIESICDEIAQYHADEAREAEKEPTASVQEASNAVVSTVSAAEKTSDFDMIIFSEISQDGTYTDKESVAYYIHTYHRLPSNYISKAQARKLGWHLNSDNLWDVAYGKSIGGGIYNDSDGSLPDATDRIWYECDIDYAGGNRGRKRLLYSNDGLIYYTEDYESFEQLY